MELISFTYKFIMWRNYLSSFFVIVLVSCPGFSIRREILSHEFINSINQKKTTWTAGENFPQDTSLEYLRKIGSGALVGTRDKITTYQNINVNIPSSFDGRTAWNFCESLNDIRSQGSCGGCWAFATTEAMTDRLCIQTNGTVKFKFSSEDLLTCCTHCGSCGSGETYDSWNYWIEEGIVSGGDINSNEGCQPFSPLAHNDGVTPQCVRSCQSYYPVSYQKDKHYGSEMHYVPLDDLRQLQYEIMMNGPAVATHQTFEDLYNYKSGVYQHVSGGFVGYHAVKILGWGVERGAPYWLIANSWGKDWGDRGFYKILRGSNEVGIEENVNVGTPKLK